METRTKPERMRCILHRYLHTFGEEESKIYENRKVKILFQLPN